MKADPWQIDRAVELADGEMYNFANLGYTVHRYKDGWWLLWNKPTWGKIGSILRVAAELKLFMNGCHLKGQRIDGRNF